MSNRIKTILEFISTWGNLHFYGPLLEDAYSPEALEKLADEIDAESGTGLKSVRAQRLRNLAKTRAERLKKLEAAQTDAMFDMDEKKVKKIGGIQSRVIGAEKAEYDPSRKPGTSLEQDDETGEVFKVLGKQGKFKPDEEPEEKPSLLTRIFGAIGKGAEKVRTVSDMASAAQRFTKAATVPVSSYRNTDLVGATGDLARQTEVTAKSAKYKSATKDEISSLKEKMRDPKIDPNQKKEIRERIKALEDSLGRTRTTRADLLRSGATIPNRPTVSNIIGNRQTSKT